VTAIDLLDSLKDFIENCTQDMLLSVRQKPSETEIILKPPEVHKMRLPKKDDKTKRVPYILLQFLTGKDMQPPGVDPSSECNIRIVVATYSENESEGSMDLLNVLSRVRLSLLKAGVVGGCFEIKKPLEFMAYPDETAPYYLGEMITLWDMPAVEREATLWP